jgi:hypothetical protein
MAESTRPVPAGLRLPSGPAPAAIVAAQQPVWDGRGDDPWLPRRLEARFDILTSEQDIRAAIWAGLSEWLTATVRRVLRLDGPPDLSAIWAQAPAWLDVVEHVVRGEIFKALRTAFERVTGIRVDLDSRAATTRYLAEAANRLRHVPEEVYDLVAAQVSTGVNLGEGSADLRDRVQRVLSTTETPHWENRATVIARTEAIGAMNAGRMEGFAAVVADDPEEEWELMWLATDDSRTRPTHVEADGQRVPWGAPFSVGGFSLAFPGDPLGPPQEVIQCRCVPLLVDSGEVVDRSNRQMRT